MSSDELIVLQYMTAELIQFAKCPHWWLLSLGKYVQDKLSSINDPILAHDLDYAPEPANIMINNYCRGFKRITKSFNLI